MATMRFLDLKSHFYRVCKGCLTDQPFCSTMFRSGYSFLVYVYTFMLSIFGFITRYMYRSKRWHLTQENGSSFSANHSQEVDRVFPKKPMDFGSNGLVEEEKNSEFIEKGFNRRTGDSVFIQSGLIGNTHKYQVISGKNISWYVEEPQTMKFTIQELFLGGEISPKIKSLKPKFAEDVQQPDDGSDSSSSGSGLVLDSCWFTNESTDHERQGSPCRSPFTEQAQVKDAKIVPLEVEDDSAEDQDFSCEVNLLPDGLFPAYYKENDKPDFADKEFSVSTKPEHDQVLYQHADQVKAEEDVGTSENVEKNGAGDSWFNSIRNMKEHDIDEVHSATSLEGHDTDDMPIAASLEDHEVDDMHFSIRSLNHEIDVSYFATANMDEHETDDLRFAIRSSDCRLERVESTDDEYIEFEPQIANSAYTGKENLPHTSSRNIAELSKNSEVTGFVDVPNEEEEVSTSKSWDEDLDDEDESDILLEHRNLVQQMKMELKNARTRGLPTISEECETPKMVEDLKPLQLEDHKFEYKDIMEEIHKFYGCYAERMRKLDVLNYQTLHAISFLHLKDSELFTSGKKNSTTYPKKSFSLPNFWPVKGQRIHADQTFRSMMEMHRELELVYVGQVCLSWEILCWQYVRVKELLKYDSQGYKSYNRVAEEFQQFQVLVQRFVEDETFQGPRVQNYVKNRCMIRSLLQVPIIKEDCAKEKKEIRDEAEAIPLETLSDIIWESVLVFWEFIRADKAATNVVLKTKMDHQDVADAELLMDVAAILQKKERRLKEIAWSQNCIVKKLQKHQEGRLNDVLFTCRLELRMVTRVLNLSRLTINQLVWCQKKLENINFISRKVHMEPSFSLFPC